MYMAVAAVFRSVFAHAEGPIESVDYPPIYMPHPGHVRPNASDLAAAACPTRACPELSGRKNLLALELVEQRIYCCECRSRQRRHTLRRQNV